jgi:Regulator of ribonuclease activity B
VGTEDEIAKLDAEGVPADRPIWTEYFFSHFGARPTERQAFRDAMLAAGFTNLGADTEGADPNYLHYWSHTIRTADRDALREADRLAATIADKHGVRYRGWEVARLPSTDELRPVE